MFWDGLDELVFDSKSFSLVFLVSLSVLFCFVSSRFGLISLCIFPWA